MSGPGRFRTAGDAGHGGDFSPGDGEHTLASAEAFLDAPTASTWTQSGLPYAPGDAYPGDAHARPLHAAFVVVAVPDHPRADELLDGVRTVLMTQADDPSLDFWDGSKYPVDYHGAGPSPIFHHAHWMTRLIKARDLLGREALSAAENATFDRWIHGYANWTAHWLHHEQYGKQVPGRLDRDYSRVYWPTGTVATPYDGGPGIGHAALAYSNRHAAVASTMSLAANYLAKHDGRAPAGTTASYGRYTVDQLLDHSRIFVEETLRFSVFPQGFQGDFERGDASRHNASPQQGWLYSANVLANVVEMADYHARRGDRSLWEFRTVAGHAGSAGAPTAGGFTGKSLEFYAWSMSRYVNGGWGRTNRGEPLALPHFFHDVLPAATVARWTHDPLLEAAWRREGHGFPRYPQSPQTQGPWSAHLGEGAKSLGLIELAPS